MCFWASVFGVDRGGKFGSKGGGLDGGRKKAWKLLSLIVSPV